MISLVWWYHLDLLRAFNRCSLYCYRPGIFNGLAILETGESKRQLK